MKNCLETPCGSLPSNFKAATNNLGQRKTQLRCCQASLIIVIATIDSSLITYNQLITQPEITNSKLAIKILEKVSNMFP